MYADRMYTMCLRNDELFFKSIYIRIPDEKRTYSIIMNYVIFFNYLYTSLLYFAFRFNSFSGGRWDFFKFFFSLISLMYFNQSIQINRRGTIVFDEMDFAVFLNIVYQLTLSDISLIQQLKRRVVDFFYIILFLGS